MLPTLAFWAALLLPGLLCVERFAVREAGGLLSRIALGYLASFALLSPVSLLGYAFGAPLALLSAGASLLVGAALGLLVWSAFGALRRERGSTLERLRRAGTWLWARMHPAAVVGLALIAADMVAGARVGSHLGGDAPFHVARVRMLFDYGFNNWDPYVGGGAFSRVYHTNLYHALMASCAQLTGSTPIQVWCATLPLAKLLIASAAYHLSWSVLGVRWAAWLAAIVSLLWYAPVTFMLYPNQIAPLWAMALGLAFFVRSFGEGPSYAAALKLAAAALVTAQIHMLYALALALLLGPPLAYRGLRSALADRRAWPRALAVVAALALAGPFLLVARYADRPAPAEAAPPPAGAAETVAPAKKPTADVSAVGDQLILDPGWWVDPAGFGPFALLGLACGVFTRRRREVLALCAVLLTAASLFYLPGVFGALARAVGGAWVVERMQIVFSLVHFALLPGAPVLLLSERTGEARFVPLVGLALALSYVALRGIDGGYFSREKYAKMADDPARRQRRVVRANADMAFVRQHIEPGATVLAAFYDVSRLGMLCKCHVVAVAPGRGSPDVPGMNERRRDAARLLALDTSMRERVALLRKHDVRYLYTMGKPGRKLRRSYQPLIEKTAKRNGLMISTLRR